MMSEKKPLIVVIDSSSETLTWLYSVLYGEGYLVATCPPTTDALRFVSAYKPAVAIVGRVAEYGVNLPLVSRIKEISPDTRVLVLAESSDWPTLTDAEEAGADQVLWNPYSWGDVLRKVDRLHEEAEAFAGRATR
jgi:DNA-binding NtrC family response regulator